MRSSGQPGVNLFLWSLPFLFEFGPPKMKKQLLILEEEDLILLFIDPDGIVILFGAFDI